MSLESGLTLAYIGDAVYELKIREYLLSSGKEIVKEMHNEAIIYTQAVNQAKIAEALIPKLSEDELEYYKRGRNTGGTHRPKNATLHDYREATGLEALIGSLYLEKKNQRLDEIIAFSIDFINNGKSPKSAI